MNPFEEFWSLQKQKVNLENKINKAINLYVKDNAEKINPESPNDVLFKDWWTEEDGIITILVTDKTTVDRDWLYVPIEELLEYFNK